LPGHEGHKWGDCRSNRYGFEHEQQRNQNNNNGNNRGSGSRNQSRSESNVSENNRTRRVSFADNQNSNNHRSNSNPQSAGDSQFFCLEVDDTLAGSPESFLFEDTVQEIFEAETYDGADLIVDDVVRPKLPPNISKEVMTPSTLAIAKQVNEQKGQFLFKSLLDPGGSHVLLNRRSLPKDCQLFVLPTNNSFNTTAGGLATTHYVFLHDVILPEFSYNRRIKTVKAFVFNNADVVYDVILGAIFSIPVVSISVVPTLLANGMVILFLFMHRTSFQTKTRSVLS
jgi:hypothetical protein